MDYANVTGRPTSRFVKTAAALHRGIGHVQRQHRPYARSWQQANAHSLTLTGPRWIVLGDSMSQGIGAASFDAGWVNQVQRRLVEDGLEVSVVNLSANGARVSDLLQQQLPAWRALPAEPGDNKVIVTVLVGSNDLMNRERRARLASDFGTLADLLPSGAIVATLPQPRAAARAANAELLERAAAGTITVVDMRTSGPPSWRGKLAADHFHPNELGYAGIADAFYEPIRAALLAVR